MRKIKEYKQRLSLSILFSLIVSCYMVITLLIVGGALYILLRSGFITGQDYDVISPTAALIFATILNFVVGVLISYFLSKFVLRPVNSLINMMNRLAAGDYKTRIKINRFIKTYPALLEFAESFNIMAEELDKSETLRSEFINNFSHEFKTPIVSIAGFAKLLKKDDLTDKQRREYLDIIEEESLRLAEMATNVLNLTNVENRTILANMTEFNLSEQLRTCILLLEKKWTGKNIDFDLDFGEYNITADEELLKQVWINLIDNAVKFSPENSTVDISAEQTGNVTRVRISNGGKCIPPEDRQRIFNKFYQADPSRATEGNGIGLALVKRAVELHGGTVSVKSENGLTTFTVELSE